MTGDGLSVGMLTPSWPPGGPPNGIVTYVATVAPALVARGLRVSLLTQHRAGPSRDGLPLYATEEIPTPGVLRLLERVGYRFAPRTVWRASAGRRFAEATRRMVAEQGVDVLEMEESFGWAAVALRAVATPLHLRLHGPFFLTAEPGTPRDAAFRWRVRREGLAIAGAHAVSAPSRDVLERVRRHYRLALPGAVVIPNPTAHVPAAARWTLGGCHGRRILFVGRFDRLKGGDLVLEAFARVAAADPGAELVFVGPDGGMPLDDGRTLGFEAFLAERLPAHAARVRYLGRQPREALGALRREAFVTLVPSRYESFGGTAAEAMAMGCPLVASAVGGIPELVEHGRNGLLHPPGDAAALAARILELFRDPQRAAQLGAQAAADAEQRLVPELVARDLEALYRGARGRRGRGR